MGSSIKNKLSITVFLFTVVTLVTFISCSTDETQTVTNLTSLTMSDEFNAPGTPDPTIWGYDIGTGQNGWGNNELQYYTDRSENIIVEDGMLKFTVRQESFEGSNYTSARVLTRGKFEQKHGRFEARIQLPWGQGIWPAFWLLGDDSNGTEVWPQIGEIDIMENRGQEPTLVSGAIHGPGYSGGESIFKSYELTNDRFDTGFHVFGVEWGENYINYYVDDVLYNQITPADVPGEWVFNDDFYIIMNVAVGGGFVGSPTDSTVFPQEMLVDYVRVYQ
ncbi:glycoside hydrolase family 16 protein [Winogradskyella ludwigii]|jgi:beta-glucanase (GH16 family)|uniref:glycoside hydrolase family 16 protein n=1 Tax=Winogradskyella ludwigii TaxID=2686076 RepID=UPI0015CB2F95|nr:glycoside hydrolase family 16 protein [Winogradskyella ludwigii]